MFGVTAGLLLLRLGLNMWTERPYDNADCCGREKRSTSVMGITSMVCTLAVVIGSMLTDILAA